MTRAWTRRLILSLTLCLTTVLFAALVVRMWPLTSGHSTVTPTPSPSPRTHATYRFRLEGFPSVQLHAGQHLTVRWVPELVDPASSDRATDLVCWLEFYGPYASQADADRLVTSLKQRNPAVWPIPIFYAGPQTVSNQNPEPQSMLLEVPTSLRPGIYVAASTARNNEDGSADSRYFFLRVPV